MKRFWVYYKDNNNDWQCYKKYKKRNGSMDAINALQKKYLDGSAWGYLKVDLSIIKLVDKNDNSCSYIGCM